MSQSSVCSNKARGRALYGQLSEGVQHVDLYDCIYAIISSGIQYTEKYINKPLMSLILRFAADQKNTSDTRNTSYNRLEEYNRSKEYHRSERCGPTSTQLVQLSTPSNIPGVPMVRNTGDSEDH